MNSLVVFLSMVAVAVAKPSSWGAVPIVPAVSAVAYSAPIVAAAAPAAVSHQSRLDIKSSPAIVSTAAFAPIAQAAIVEPTVYSAPAPIAPIAIAPAAIAPAAVSSQSRIDIKSSPAITSTIVSAPAALAAAPIAYSSPIVGGVVAPTLLKSAIGGVVAPTLLKSAIGGVVAPTLLKSAIGGVVAPTLLKSAIVTPGLYNSAALINPIGVSTLPLETPEVFAARAAHLQTKALTEAQLLQKSW